MVACIYVATFHPERSQLMFLTIYAGLHPHWHSSYDVTSGISTCAAHAQQPLLWCS